ncbi:MAG TPA: hypothetical protein VGV38_18455 [Pyrinomonadaceae bacterium]|nr:hypothetical protein [Pyrinomonadaceae bacterium]
MTEVEHITAGGALLACIIRAEARMDETTFLTPPDYNFQVGLVVYPEGGHIRPHAHRPITRKVTGTFEVLVVRAGRCEVDFYDGSRERVATRELRAGDLLLVVEGGHGFRMLEGTTLLEIKQGPYAGESEKEQF